MLAEISCFHDYGQELALSLLYFEMGRKKSPKSDGQKEIQWNLVLTKPLYNKVLGIMNDILQSSKITSKMYGKEPRYNKPRYSEILVITNTIRQPKH